VFIENYDIHVPRRAPDGSAAVTCGLNNSAPSRSKASGTSGQKVAGRGARGCLNMSIRSDGWWREGYDGTNGLRRRVTDSHPASIEEQDLSGTRPNLYKTLTEAGHSHLLSISRWPIGVPRPQV